MAPRFFGREVEVRISGEVKTPISFRLDEREYIISEIVAAWPDYGFGPTAEGRKKRWWQRRHRNYYQVKTTEGDVFEIYYDRGTSLKHPERKKWFLHRQL